MPIVLYRVDERLIHGQVVIGWGLQLRPDRYLVVDEALAGSAWEQDLYRLGAGDAEVVFATPDEARALVPQWRAAPERSIVLTRDIATMLGLARDGVLEGAQINLGGLRHAPGREEVLTYLHLSDDDMRDLEALAGAGVEVSAQDLPDSHRVTLETLAKTRWKSH